MLRIIAGISRRTISLSRPVLVAERNGMKKPTPGEPITRTVFHFRKVI